MDKSRDFECRASNGTGCRGGPASLPLTGAACSLLHVDLLVQHPDGEPVGYLTAKDFVVMEGGQRLPGSGSPAPVRREGWKQPTVPTRMLVIVDSPTASSPDGFSRCCGARSRLATRMASGCRSN